MHDNDSGPSPDILRRAASGDQAALDDVLSPYRHRLKQMVRLRISQQIQGRVDESDVIQETYLQASQGLREYVEDPRMPFYLWLRHIAFQKLVDAHRRHIGAQVRDAGRDICLYSGAPASATTTALAAQLLGRFSSPSQHAVKAEMRIQVQQALESLDPIDREVLVLRHFEQLSTAETAQILEISKSGATSRYLRALKRLKEELASIPGLFD